MSIFLLAISVWIRLSLNESPAFKRMKEEGKTSKAPLTESFGQWKNAKIVLLALLGLTAGQGVVWYTGQFYALFFLTAQLKVEPTTAQLMIGASLLLGTPFFIVFGTLSDKIGRKPIIMAGCLLAALTFFPLFTRAHRGGEPGAGRGAAEEQGRRPRRPGAMLVPGQPDRPRDRLHRRRATSPSASWRKARSATTTSTRRPARRRRSRSATRRSTPPAATVVNQKFDADSIAKIAAFKKEIGADLAAAGYPAKAKPIDFMSGQWWTVVAILWVLVIYVTMVYGPIAAALVELFPTRIRYTSMSLPYHIGNGWFGGLLPTTAFAIVASTGNMYNGLWYPIIVATMTFIIGTLFVRETKDVDIYAGDR